MYCIQEKLQMKNTSVFKFKTMKKPILTAIIICAALFLLLSLTNNEAKHQTYGQVVFSIPIKPKVTAIISDELIIKFIKKGYQVQNAWYNQSTRKNMFVVVKY